MSAIADECKLFFYEEITLLREGKPFWLVRHKQTGKYYVKKILPAAHREVYEALRQITSQNLPRIYECIPSENELIVIEEFINGDTLKDLVQQQGIAPWQATGIMIELCNVLFILHTMSPPIIHRDIKPENIMLSNDGIVKLMDFNIARTYSKDRSQDTECMGTVGYASPEHFGFRQTDARSDIYSCGVLLNYLLTGQMPADRLAEGPLQAIVQKCTEMNPIHRYQNVFELRHALSTAMEKGIPCHMGNYIQHPTENAAPYPAVPVKNAPEAQETPIYRWKWQKFLPPGFRTLKPWKMLIAAISYTAILDIAISGHFEVNSAAELIMTRIFTGFGMLGGVLVLFNYLGVSDRLPGASRAHGIVSWILRCLYAFLAFFLAICILVLLTDLFLP